MDLLAGFVGIMIVFVFNDTVGVEGTGYGGNCSSAACEEPNTICDTGKTNNCICNTVFFRKTSTAECAAKKTLNAACTEGQPAGQCKDTFAECRDASGFKCLCKTGNFEKKDGTCAARCELKQGCYEGSSHYRIVDRLGKSPKVSCASGECVTHASCDSGTSKCVCDAGYDQSPIISPTMCSGVVKVITQSYMYLVPILVFMMLLLR